MIHYNILTKNLNQHIAKNSKLLFKTRKYLMHCENCNIYVKNLRQHMKSQRHIKLINEVSKGDYSQLIMKKDYSIVAICVMYK